MFDNEDDDLPSESQLDLNLGDEGGATDFSAQSRKRAPLDFSDLVPKGAEPKAERKSRAPLDFSDLIPSVPAGQVPTPRPRPAEADAIEGPVPIPRPRPAEAPAPVPDPNAAQPGENGVFPAQSLEGAPFRSGGTALDTVFGSTGGMLSGDEGSQQQKDRILAAQQEARDARTQREEAKMAYDEAVAAARLTGGAGDALVLRQIRQRTGIGAAETRLSNAEKELSSALRAPIPTQTGLRDTMERAPGAAVDQATSTARGAARIGLGLFDLAHRGTMMAAGEGDPGSVTAGADRWLDEKQKEITDQFSAKLFKKDEAQNEELGSKLVQGVVSTGMFAATGAAGRVIGLSPWLTTAIAGALPQGEQQFQQAQRAAEITPGYAKAWMKNYGLDVSEETANNLVKWSMFATGLGVGATEAVPVAHLFERLEHATGGGFTRWLGIMAAQAGEEGLQEGVQQLLENAAVKGLLDPNREIDKEVGENALVGALSGAMVSGVVAGPAVLAGHGAQPHMPAPVEPAPTDLTDVQPPAAAPSPQQVEGAPAPAPAAQQEQTSPQQGEVAPPAAEQAPAPTATATERRTLRKIGYSDEMIDGMNRAEIAAEVGTAAEQGIEPEKETPAEHGKDNGIPLSEQREPVDFSDLVPDGSRQRPARITDQADIDRAAAKVNTEPSEAQKEAGNYQKGHFKWQGLDFSIENPAGSIRSGTDENGQPWQAQLPAAYGYIKRTTGKDGDHVDVFFQGDGPIHVIDQINPKTGRFDEHKVVIGPQTADEAVSLYRSAFSDSDTVNRIGAVTEITPQKLKAWLRTGKATRPLGNIAEPEKSYIYHSTSPGNLVSITKKGLVPNGDGVWFAPNERMARVWHTDGNVTLRVDRSKLPELRSETPGLANPESESLYHPSRVPARLLEASRDGGATWKPLAEAAREKVEPKQDAASAVDAAINEAFIDAKENVEEALSNVNVPAREVDPADVERAARISAETGVSAEEAFQQAMAEQIEGTENGERGAVSGGIEEGEGRGQQAKGEQLPGRGKAGEERTAETNATPETDQGGERARAGEPAGGDQAGEPQPQRHAEATDAERSGNPEEAQDAGVGRAETLADRFAAHLREGGEFKNILAARKMAKEAGFNGDAKAVEEALELGVVQLARQIVADRSDPKANFTALVDLYSRQPKLGTRTSTSMRDQAFSTPVPLAYVASRFAHVGPESLVYEPTAGNGSLVIEASPDHVVANEINAARAENLRSQGFDVTTNDASEKFPGGSVYDVVLANPPFGPVRQEGKSQVFDLSDIQPGYKTKEIDHAIALRALEAMRDDGRATLIIGGINKLAESREARSDAYNGKAKREFFKALYDRYNVVDHFTVAGELYERQGAGWPVDVIVIDGRGKSARKLPAVDVPRVLNSWDQLGGLIDVSGRGEGETDRASDRTTGAGPGERDGGMRGGGERVSELDAGPQQPGEVQPGSVQRPVDERLGPEGRAESAGAERGDAERTGEQPAPERRPPGLTADEAVTNALDEAFGPQAGPKSSLEPARTTREVAKSAVSNAAQSADAAFSGLYELFGGNKVSSGLSFDEDTYAKAKPLFMQAAEKFAALKDDIGELAKRMVVHMRDTLAWPREVFERMRPYLVRFIQDVQKGAVSLDRQQVEQPAASRKAEAKQEQETERQVAYKPKSGSQGLGTLVPVNMRSSISDALAGIEQRVGPLDTYIGKQLGYDTDETGAPYFERNGERVYPFAAEQVDALALAIENIERGKGFIIGDQTGIGKGRVNAGILRYAMMNNRVPIFVTAKPNLYGDMYRDLTDIGIQESLGHDLRILATNSDLNVPLTEEDKPVMLRTGDSAGHKKLLNGVRPGNFTDSYDVLFTTYNQMQTVAGKDTDRRSLLKRLAPSAVISFDESHEAGGQGAKTARQVKGAQANRSDFARGLIDAAKGVFYSSATYAKRPDVINLYSATDMPLAVEKKEDLAEAIARGGVPMQQVVAAMLAKAGQYIRRERSFAGVEYNTPIIPTDHELYDRISGVLADIQKFSEIVRNASDRLDEEIKSEAQAISGDNATGDAGASSLLFTSIMHNVINQMLLALKARPAAQMAIEALRRGEKPVITLANTMESLLSDYAAQMGLKAGDVIDADFGSVLTKYLDRTRTLIIKKPYSKDPVVRRYLTDEELGKEGLAAYNGAKSAIDTTDMSGLSASPIDRIKQDLANAGYKVGEITGRGTIIDYAGDQPVLRNRPGGEMSIRGRRETLQKFNNGGLDALILNQAGSTGLSAHASEKYKDQRQRHMMIAQAEGNIDTHMQMLGRVHRTGQVIVPKYSQLVADIPAEKRPAAVLAKKMASLNANTTASRGGALTAKDVPDFINEYGDMIAATIAADDPDLNRRLGLPIKIDENGKVTVEDAMRRLTGRIPLLPLAEQEELYGRLEADYDALIQQMDAAGENALEAKTLDLKARPLERTEVVKAKSGLDSPFAAPVHMEKTSIARQGKPFSAMELMNRISEQLGGEGRLEDVVSNEHEVGNAADMLAQLEQPDSPWGRQSADNERTAREDALDEFDTYKRGILDEISDASKQEKERVKLDGLKDRWSALHEALPTGARITLKTSAGNITAIVINTERTGQAKNPLALSSWKTTFAVADAAREVMLPFSRLYQDGKSSSEDKAAIEIAPIGWIETPAQTIERFADMQNSAREERYIATGNLLAAYDWLNMKGRIINYTDEQGHIRQGILTAKGFNVDVHFAARARPFHGADEVVKWMRANKGQEVWSEDNVVRLNMLYDKDLYVTVERSKRTGGKYFLDKALTDITGDFYQRGGTMVANVLGADNAKIEKVVRRLQDLGATFVDRTEATAPKAEKIEQPPEVQANLRRSPEPITARLKGDELGSVSTHTELRDAAYRHYEQNFVRSGLTVTNDKTGFKIAFNPVGLRKATRVGDELLKLVPALPDMLRHGTLIRTEQDREANQNVKAVHTFAAAVEIGGQRRDVVMVVRETKDGAFHYSLHNDRDFDAGDRSVSSRPKGEESKASIHGPPALEGVPGSFNIAYRTAPFNGGFRKGPEAQAHRERLQEQLSEIVDRIVGRRAEVSFEDTIPINGPVGWGSYGAENATAAGTFVPAQSLVRIAMNDPKYTGTERDTAYHEAFHALEYLIWRESGPERLVLAREDQRLRQWIAQNMRFSPALTQEQLAELAPYEVRALAFEGYVHRRERGESMAGVHTAIRAGFERLMQIIRRVRNFLRGLGYRTAEDVFSDIYEGKVRARADREERSTMAGAAAAVDRGERYSLGVRRRAPQAGDVIPSPESFAEAMSQPKSFKERVSDAVDALLLTPTRAMWDRQIDLLRFQKAAEAVGSPVTESLDTYLAATLYPGRAGERLKDAVKQHWEPVYDAMRDHSISRDDMQDFLYARHAPERNAQIREIDPSNDAGSGMTDAEAAEIMGRLADRLPRFNAVAALIDRIVAHNREVMQREGLENERTLEHWADTYQYYVPLKGFEADSDSELIPTPSAGRGFDIRRSESDRALGRFDRADDILANLLDQTQRTIIRSEKNRVAKTFLRFAQANPSPYYKIGLAERKRRINPLTGLVEEYWANLPTHLDRVFAAKVGGKTYYIEIKHNGLLESLKSLGADKMNPFLRFMGRLTREYSRFQTAKNPEFVFTNLVKDMQDAGFTLSGEKRAMLLRRYAANMLKGKALYGAILGTNEMGEGKEARRWYEEWREAGGKISHYGFQDLEQIGKEIQRELDRRTESTAKSAALAVPRFLGPFNGTAMKFLEALSEVTESTTRLAVYISGREAGLTKAEAARLSRNATVDFQRRGKYGTALGALYAFANAGIQGNVRMLRTLRKSKIARRAAVGIAVAGMLMTFWNMAVSPEDDEKKKAYEKRPYWERERNILIYMPGSKNAIKIPLGYGLNVFWMMGEQLAMRMLGKVKTGEMTGNLLGTMASAFNPLGSEGSWFDWKTWVSAYTPTVMRPVPELGFNRNWFGGTIHPDEMPWNKYLPHSDRHKISTHPAAVATAEFLNRMTGGNKFEPGAVSLYPDDIEYGWNFAVGGLGRFLANTSGTIADAIDGVDHPVERVPFVRRFVASDNSPAVQAEAYYKKRSEEQAKTQRLRAAIKARADGSGDASTDEVIERLSQETGAQPNKRGTGISVPSDTVFRSADTQIKKLREQEDAVRKDRSLSAAQRKSAIDALRQQMRDIMGEARSRVPATAQ